MKIQYRYILLYTVLTVLAMGPFFSIYTYGVNVPHWDDHAILHFVQNWNWSKFASIFSFHNEHRIGLTRIAALKTNWILGNLDFKFMMYLGQLGLVFVFGWFIFWVYRMGLSLLWLIIPAMLIFNNSTYENSLWAMAAVQNNWIIFWSLSSLFLIVISTQTTGKKELLLFIAAIFVSLMALISSGNGVVVAPAGLLLLLISGKSRSVMVWASVQTLFLILYFQGFEGGESSRPHLEDFFLNFITLCGSILSPLFAFKTPVKWSMIIGFAQLTFTLVVFLKLFFRRKNTSDLLSFLAFTLFILGTITLVSIGRSGYDRGVLLTSKYKIYSFLLFCVNVIYLYSNEKSRWLTPKQLKWLLVAVFLFVNAQLSFSTAMKTSRNERLNELYRFKNEKKDWGIYKPPAMSFEQLLNTAYAEIDKEKHISVKGMKDRLSFDFETENHNAEHFVWIRNENHSEIIGLASGAIWPGNRDLLSGELLLFNFPSGNYEIYLLQIDRNKAFLFDIDKAVFIQGLSYNNPKKNW